MLKLLIATGCALLFSMNGQAKVRIITADEAKKMIEASAAFSKVTVLDVRAGYKDYFRGHLPQAVHLNFDTLRGTDENGVPVQYLPSTMAQDVLRRAAVDQNKTHIIYAGGGTGDEILSTSMVAYVLEMNGIQDVAVVDGGLDVYKTKFGASQQYPKHKASKVQLKPKNIGVTVKEVIAEKEKANVVLVDARPVEEYKGETNIWMRNGHIPGAMNFPWRKVMNEENTHLFKPVAAVEGELKKMGITPDKDVIVYCGTSREGSLLRFYLKHVMNYPKVRLYEGSWKEYAALSDLPMATGATLK